MATATHLHALRGEHEGTRPCPGLQLFGSHAPRLSGRSKQRNYRSGDGPGRLAESPRKHCMLGPSRMNVATVTRGRAQDISSV